MRSSKGFFTWIRVILNEDMGLSTASVINAVYRFPLAIISILFTAILIFLNFTVETLFVVLWGAYVIPFWLVGLALFTEARNLPRGWELILGALTSITVFWYAFDSANNVLIESLYALPALFVFMLTAPFLKKGGWKLFRTFQKQFWYRFGTIFGVGIAIYLLSNFICFATAGSGGGCFWFMNRMIFFTLIPLWGVCIVPEVK